MPIDPVILVAEEIRTLEKQIHAALKGAGAYDRKGMEAVNLRVERLRVLYADLLETNPTSALGAGELIRFAADLSFSQGRYCTHLNRIAERLAAGERQQSDLIWLRALAEAVAEEVDAGKNGKRIAKLLSLAVKGMALPVLVWRAAMPKQAPIRDVRALLAGPGEMAPAPFVPRRF